MSEVALRIGGRTYRVACAAGEEERVTRLGATIADKLAAMGNPSGPEAQNLLFAALMLADEVQEARESGSAAGESSRAAEADARAEADANAAAAEREQLASRVADLEAEVARWQSAAQSSAEEVEQAHARETELTRAVASHEDEAAKLHARISDLEEAEADTARTPRTEGTPDTAALAPALERFAEMLEECADKLERRAAGS